MYQTVLYEVANGVATISLNRPDVYNAFNNEMSFELIDALKQAGKDKQVRVVVLTGIGKAFCSGQDLKAIDNIETRSLAESIHKRYNPMIRGIRNMPKPVICRLNGVAAGAGASLALACDMIIASSNAVLIEVFVNIGLVPDSGSSFFVPLLVGYHKAFELCTLGTKVTMEEAKRLNIVHQVTEPESLDEAVQQLAAHYAQAPTKSIGLIKKMLNKAQSSNLDTMLEYEAYCQEIAGKSDDYKEGLSAFKEKRKPNFTGN